MLVVVLMSLCACAAAVPWSRSYNDVYARNPHYIQAALDEYNSLRSGGDVMWDDYNMSGFDDEQVWNRNSIIVRPTNGLEGHEWYNRDFGRTNMITVPPNCIPPQVWYNGSCRDVQPDDDEYGRAGPWISKLPVLRCPVGQIRDKLGNCRPVLPKQPGEKKKG